MAVDELKRIIIEQGLPKTDMALYGILCPYCGKSDRIRKLESPGELQIQMNPRDLAIYRHFWDELLNPDTSLAVCKFCQNPLKLPNNGQAQPINE
ncbi:MAG: hypothetical protein JSU83_18335 [Deltaproteobacteria bacterium]|nr:MAG: hypothetical protein JSU83_18335 [Deltaproteobacteria bacterium]